MLGQAKNPDYKTYFSPQYLMCQQVDLNQILINYQKAVYA